MNKKLLIGAALLGLLVLPVIAGAQYVWAPTDLMEWGELDSVYIAKVVTDPVNPSHVWALTANEFDPMGVEDPMPAKGIWYSPNGGSNWVCRSDDNLKYEYPLIDLTICRSNPDIMYAATMSYGVFKTVDGGLNWFAVNNGLTYNEESFPNNEWTVLAVAVEPDNPNNVYCSVANLASSTLLTSGPDHPGFYKSTNGGQSWISFNDGLPQKSGMQSTVAASIVIPYQAQQYVVLGMLDLELKISLFQGAKSSGQVYFSSNRAATAFNEISTGLPHVNAGIVLIGISASGSLMYLSTSPGNPMTIMASHLGVKGEVSLLGDASGVLASGGVFKLNTSNGQWVARNSGLPVVNDDYNDNSINAGSVAVSPINPDILLAGIFLSESDNPNLENDKIYLTQNGGGSWTKNWDSGMTTSPHGFRSPVPMITVFNSNMTAAYSSVHWSDSTSTGEDSGVWRLPPASLQTNDVVQNMESTKDDAVTSAKLTPAERKALIRNTFARLPWPFNLFNRNLK